MKKLRIAMLSPIHWRTPPRAYGPWEQVASDITEELVRRGHEVTLYATPDSITTATLKSITPFPLLEEGGKQLDHRLYGLLHSAMPFEDANDFDVIHNHYDGYPLALSRIADIPVVSTVHGFSSPDIHKLYLRYNNVHYVSISYADRKHCPEMNWVANIHHGINMSDWQPNTEPEEWLGFIGRIHPHKGTHIAIEVAKQTGQQLKIAGAIDYNDPVVQSYWDDAIKPQLDGKQISYLDEIGGGDKVEFYRQARAIIAPIQWEEPFGLVLIEAMAAGTPVVAFGRGSVPEVISDGISGFVVTPDDVTAMVEATKQVHTIDRVGVRKYAEEHFSVEKMVDQYESVYLKATN